MQIRFPASPQWSWTKSVFTVLAAWLGASLMLDFVVMPSLYWTGMMNSSDFAGAGYVLFGLTNHFEVLAAALVLTGLLILISNGVVTQRDRLATAIQGLTLLSIALFYTYCLTPAMSALALSLDGSSVIEVTRAMNILQGEYWALELIKFTILALLISRFSLLLFPLTKPQQTNSYR
ncbi:MAG: hypothetical protein HC824_14055 [Synechococcales cyanobacterium RM1_1_8]|nr:hypothetical protein [Synechococcales cyanobacterium RM1_1_8]